HEQEDEKCLNRLEIEGQIINQIRVVRGLGLKPRRKSGLERLPATPQPRIRTPMHSPRSCRKRFCERCIAIKAQAQLACLEMAQTLRAFGLAGVNRIADAGAAIIATQAFE